MKGLYIISILLVFVGCTSQKKAIIKRDTIAYRFTDKVEQLLLKQIREIPKTNYCILIQEKENLKHITLVSKYSFFHKKTSYHALIGEKYYPISFPQFDRKFGVAEDAEKLLMRKINSNDSEDFMTKKSYPLYHNVYTIKVDNQNNIVFEGNEY